MATVKTLAEKLRELRIKYSEQISGIQTTYEADLARNKERTAKIKKADYASKYTGRYRSLADSVKAIYAQIEQIEERTHGLKFKASEYIKTVRAEKFDSAQVETFFGELVKRCADCAQELAKDKPFADYEEDLRNFCGLYVTANYLCENADKILAESGIPESERAADLAAAEKELKEIKEIRAKGGAMENLPCYGEMVALINDVRSSSSRIKEDMLGSGKFYFNRDFKYLMGFWKEKIADEDVEFAQKVLGLSPSELSSQPIYFTPQDGPCNVVIDVHEKHFNHPVYVSFIKSLYCSIMSRQPKNSVVFGSIACDIKSKRNIVLLQDRISKLETGKSLTDSNYIFKECVQNENGVKSALEDINDTLLDVTSTVRIDNNESSVYALNLKAEQARQPFHFVCVDNYPAGFSSISSDSSDTLRQIMRDDARMGFFVVISQNADAKYTEKNAKIEKNESDLNAMFIDMTDPDHVKINGREAILDIALPSYNENDFWIQLKAYYEKKETFFINQMFDEVDSRKDEIFGRLKAGQISVPLGYADKSLFTFDFDLNSACHTFILGGSSSGKTSFLHTLILSTAYSYSPDEVNFYLADYKGSELSFYARKDIQRLPHVKYYLAKNKQESKIIPDWLEMTQMILRIMKYRNNKLFADLHAKDIMEYNAKSRKKLPYIIVLMDEYQSMLSEATSQQRAAFCKSINSLLNQARSAGIVLMLVGHNKDTGDISLNNVFNRLIVSALPDAVKDLCYNGTRGGNAEKIVSDEKYLSVPKEGRILFGKIGESGTRRFRAAFAGDHDEKIPVVDRICKKYEGYETEPMIVGGTVEPFYISEPTMPPYDSMTEPVLKEEVVGDEDDFDYDPYDREAYPLYVGVTATDTYPSALSFSTSKTSSGYMMYTALSDRLSMFLRSTVLSFLYKTAKMGCKYKEERVYFFAQEDEFNNDIGKRIDALPFIGEHVRHYETKHNLYESLSALIELKELYESRGKERAPRGGWPPVLVVLHDVDWLVSPDLDRVITEARAELKSGRGDSSGQAGFSEKEISETVEQLREVYLLMGRSLSEDALRTEAVAALTKEAQKQSGVKKSSTGHFTGNDVKDAIATLYTAGNTCGIFVLVGSELRDSLIAFKNKLGSKESISVNTVFGSFSEAERGFSSIRGEDAGNEIEEERNICYVNPGNVRTRIYQFRMRGDAEWIQNLENMLSKGVL